MLRMRIAVQVILQSFDTVVERTRGGFALQLGVIEKGFFLESGVEIIFGSLLEALCRKRALSGLHVTIGNEEIALLSHRIGILVIGGTGEIGDGIGIFQYTIIGEAFRKPVVTVKRDLVVVFNLVEIFGGFFILVLVVIGQSHAAGDLCHVLVFHNSRFGCHL